MDALTQRIRDLLSQARNLVSRNVNTLQVLTNFEVGRLIVEHEQQGVERAAYAEETLKSLSGRLTVEFGRGFSWRNLYNMRRFYIEFRDRILQTPSAESLQQECQTVSGQSRALAEKPQTPSGQLPILQTLSAESAEPFRLSWSHYVFLLGVSDRAERRFYELESAAGNWSIRELKRQFNSGLYERLALSRDKKKVAELARSGQVVEQPTDMLKDPYVLEFLGMEEHSHYSERELEAAIIDKLEHFLLELGKGFLFEARQKRFTFDSDHFYVDLVFYNRLLRCYVLIDLKIGQLTHQDIGQMQMYVHYFDRHVKLDTENPTVGIILCKTKNDALVELTLPEDQPPIFAREYQLYLPDKAVLKQRLMQWSEEVGMDVPADEEGDNQ